VSVQEVVGGFAVSPEHADQLQYVFTRIIFALRLRFQRPAPSSPPPGDKAGTALPDCSIQQWLNGAEIVAGPLSAIITLTDPDAGGGGGASDARKSQIIVTCRGPTDQRRQLFFMQVLLSQKLFCAWRSYAIS